MRRAGVRLAGSAISLIGASFVGFILLRALPGNPARLVSGPLASQDAVDQLVADLGLNDPLPIQFWHYVSNFVTGDWGFSYTTGETVLTLMSERLPATLELGFYAFLIAFGAAVTLAVAAAYQRQSRIDRSVRGIAYLALGTPPFWLALIGLIIGASALGVFPGPEGRLSPDVPPPEGITGFYTFDALLSGRFDTFVDAAWHLALPACVLAAAPFAFLVRLLRMNLLEVANEPYLLVARGKGLRRRTAFVRHALPNALLPTMTASGLIFAELLTGSVLIEGIFAWEGVGDLVVSSISRRDYAVVQAFIFITAVAYILVNLIIDLLYGVVDPRVRLPASES